MPLCTMPDQNEELNLEVDSEEQTRSEKRIKDLSEKVRLTSEERDELKRLSDEKDATLAEANRERDFYKGFTDVVSANPAAKEHQEEILAKVKGGYTVEDATFAVLGKAGKLGQPKPIVDNPAGGSAVTQPPTGGPKAPKDMTREEKRSALLEAEARGDISMS